MKLADCDGGSKDENTTAANVLLSHDNSLGTLLQFLHHVAQCICYCYLFLYI